LCVARAWLQRGDAVAARAVLAPLLRAARRLHWIPIMVTAGAVDARAAAVRNDPTASRLADRVTTLAQQHGMTAMLQPE